MAERRKTLEEELNVLKSIYDLYAYMTQEANATSVEGSRRQLVEGGEGAPGTPVAPVTMEVEPPPPAAPGPAPSSPPPPPPPATSTKNASSLISEVQKQLSTYRLKAVVGDVALVEANGKVQALRKGETLAGRLELTELDQQGAVFRWKTGTLEHPEGSEMRVAVGETFRAE